MYLVPSTFRAITGKHSNHVSE